MGSQHLDISDSFTYYITDNTSLAFNLLQIPVDEDIYLSSLLILFWYRSIWFLFMYDHSITDNMVFHNLHRTLDLIFKDFSVPRVVTCLL